MSFMVKFFILSWTFVFIFSCSEDFKRSPLHFFPLLYKGKASAETQPIGPTSPLTVSYSPSEYFFSTGQAIATVTPIVEGTLVSCSITPALPSGLTFDSTTCGFSGTPTVSQPATIYTVSASNGTTATTANLTITISSLPFVSYDFPSMGNPENIPSVTVPVSLNMSSTQTVTVDYTVTGGTATSGVDYTLANGTLTFAPGTTTQNFTITIIDDALYELNEEIVVTLSNPTNAQLGGNFIHIYTISNDDPMPTVNFTTALQANAEAIPTITATVQLSAVSGVDATIPFSFNGTSTATLTSDYTFTPASPLTIPAGATTASVTFTIVDNALHEADETIILDMGTIVNAGPGGTTSQTIIIQNDDPMPTVGFDTPSSNGSESIPSVNIPVSLSTASGQTVSVNYSVTSGTATGGGVDYTLANGTLTFTPGVTSQNISLNIVNDTLNELDETITITLDTPVNVTLAGNTSHTYTIMNDDPIPDVGFVFANTSNLESVTSANLAVDLSTASGQTVSVNYSVTGGTATGGGVDYTLANGTLTFTPGVTSQNIVLSIVNDTLYESAETITVTLDTPTNANLAGNISHTYTIDNDDPIPTVQFTTTAQTNPESTATVTVTVQLSAASGLATTVPFSINASSTATLTDDYTFTPATPIIIAAGNTTADITFTIVNDTLYENDETIVINIGTPTNANLGTNTAHTITIGNDDSLPTISFTAGATGSIAEGGGNYVLQFTLSAVSALPASVTINTADVFATAGSDYTAQVAQVVTIPAGSTTVNQNIPISEDLLYEGGETFTVTMSSPVNASLSATVTQTVTILDNEIGISSAATLDCDGNGKIDHYRLTFISAVTDSSFPGYVASNSAGTVTTDWLVAGYSNVRLNHGTSLVCSGHTDVTDDATIYLEFAEGAVFDTGAKPDVTTSTTPGLLGPAGTVARVFTPSVTEADLARPVIISITPSHTSSGIPINTTVSATFSESMNTATFTAANFTLTGAVAVTGTVSTVNATTVLFTPSAFLANNQLHTVNISNMTDDPAGNTMFNFSSTFTTSPKNKITGTVSGAATNVVLGISVNGGSVTNLAGTTTTYDTGNVLVNGQTFELSIVTQPVGQVCTLLSSSTNPAGGIFTGVTDLTVNVNCVQGYSISGRVQTIPAVENGFHLYQGTVSTIFGNGTANVVDGTGAAVQVTLPKGIVYTGGYYYFVDAGTYIRRADPTTNQVLTVAGDGSGGNAWADGTGALARFTDLFDLTTDGTYLYAAEFAGNRIRRIRIGTWEVTTLAGDTSTVTPTNSYLDGYGTAARFSGIHGLVYYNGSLYISDHTNNRIRRLNLSTLQVTTIAGNGSAATTDSGTGVGGSIYQPSYMAIIGNNLYVASDHNCIRKIILDGTNYPISTFAGVPIQSGSQDGSLTTAKFNLIRGLSTDGVNHLFVSDYSNRNIRQINISKALVTTLAGQVGVSAHADGVGIAAQLTIPYSLFFDGKNIIFADEHRIRTINNNSLVAYFPLAGNNFDYSGNYNLTTVGTPSVVTGRNGETDGAYFVGAGNGAKTSSNPTNAVHNMTIAGWVKWDGTNTGGIQILFFNGSSGTNGYGFLINGNVFRCLFAGGGGTSQELTPKLVANQWTHLALVGPYFAGGVWKVYYNGKMIQAILPPTVNSPTGFFTIGMNDANGENFRGAVADIRVYNRSLNEGEINELAQNASSALVGNSYSTGGTGLLSHYVFAGAGTALGLADRGPLAKHLTNVNSASPATGREGDTNGAYSYNGTNQVLQAPSAMGLPIDNAPRTICAWAYPKQYPSNVGLPNNTYIVTNYGTASNNSTFGIQIVNSSGVDQVGVVGWSAGDVLANYKIPLNTWTHLCSVYDGTNASFFANGIQIIAPTAKTLTTGSTFFTVGANPGTQYFPGKIDDVRVYNTALSSMQIRQLATQIPSGLMARYDFNGDTNDVSGFGNNGTISGTVTSVPDRFGSSNSAYRFPSSVAQNHISANDDSFPAGKASRTMCVWYRKFVNSGGYVSVVGYGDNSMYRMNSLVLTGTNGTSTISYASHSSDTWVDTNQQFVDNVWRHVCATYNGTVDALYVNGKSMATTVNGGNRDTTVASENLRIGSYYSAGNYFEGEVDEVIIYNRALSASEIQALSGYHPMQTSVWNAVSASSKLGFHVQADSYSSQTDNTVVGGNWQDSGGNGFHASPLSSPVFRNGINGLNERPAIQFNGTNQYFDAGDTTLNFNGLTAIAVGKSTVTGGPYSPFLSKHNTGCNSTNRFNLFRHQSSDDYLFGTDNEISLGGTLNEVVILTGINNGTNISLSKNGNTAVNTTGTVVSGTPTNCQLRVGGRPSGGEYFTGLISEILVFTEPLSTSDKQIVECYLSAKYNIGLGYACP